jgi:hypothetical protein
MTNAYDRASCPYRLVTGSTANISPAASPARSPASRAVRAATPAAVAVTASPEGSRMSSGLVPRVRATASISR